MPHRHPIWLPALLWLHAAGRRRQPGHRGQLVGRQAWPTQPFPVLLASLGIQQLSLDDTWGPTEADKAEARRRIAQYRNQGPFTPPSFEGSIMVPGNAPPM